jgi:hypothetical protein
MAWRSASCCERRFRSRFDTGRAARRRRWCRYFSLSRRRSSRPMNHAPRIFLLMRGGRPKVTELLAQRRLAELTTHARCLHANAPLGVLKDEPVAMQPNHHAEGTADVVQVVPASQLGSLKSGGERLPAQRAKLSIPWWSENPKVSTGFSTTTRTWPYREALE